MTAGIRHGRDRDGMIATVRVDGAAAATPLHAHRSLILGLVDRGRRRLTLPDGELELVAGDGFVIPPDTPHAFSAVDDGSHRVLAIDPAAGLFARLGAGRIVDAVWAEAFTALHAAAEAGEPCGGLLSRLIDETERHNQSARPALRPYRSARLAREIAAADLGGDVDLAELGRRVGVSPFHLHRLYRQSFGLTPAEHRLEARLRAARRLLLDGVAIADVAAALGFSDQSHLSRAFRRLMGVPPGEWLRQMARRPAQPAAARRARMRSGSV